MGKQMSPLAALIIGKILDYLTENGDEIIGAIRDQFDPIKDDHDVDHALKELGYEPTEERLQQLSELIEKKGEDPNKLAAVLVSKTHVV